MLSSLGGRVRDQKRYRKVFKVKKYWLGANDLKSEGDLNWIETDINYNESIKWNKLEEKEKNIKGIINKIEIVVGTNKKEADCG